MLCFFSQHSTQCECFENYKSQNFPLQNKPHLEYLMTEYHTYGSSERARSLDQVSERDLRLHTHMIIIAIIKAVIVRGIPKPRPSIKSDDPVSENKK